MNDLISRQEAIDAVCIEWCGVKHQKCKHPFNLENDESYWCDGCETVLQTLPSLPSAEPERKKGMWLDNGNGTFSCNRCQSWIPEEQHYYSNYCLYCGADMRGEENE